MWIAGGVITATMIPTGQAGPYSAGLNDPENVYDAPVPGFTGSNGTGSAPLDDAENQNRINPLFFAWADDYQDYERSDADSGFDEPEYALGPVTGDNFDVVSLGDMTAAQIANGDPPGRITLHFPKPIRNFSGADFVVFENGFVSLYNIGGTGIGGVVAELARVEVSADGVTFHAFPSTSLTATAVGGYGSINPTQVNNLAGKHVNAYGVSWGTPFDLAQVGLSEASYVRLIDVPGNGSFTDSAGRPIYDGWRTFGSGGFDLEAMGAISTTMTYVEWPSLEQLDPASRGETDDPDADGIPNLLEYAFGLAPWKKDPPSTGASPAMIVDAGFRYFEFSTLRDERLLDLSMEVQCSGDLSSWKTIARSTGGAPYQAVNGFALAISNESAGDIASVGVIRRDRIRDLRPVVGSPPRFYRVRISQSQP